MAKCQNALFSCCVHRNDVAGFRDREAETLLAFGRAMEAAHLPAF